MDIKNKELCFFSSLVHIYQSEEANLQRKDSDVFTTLFCYLIDHDNCFAFENKSLIELAKFCRCKKKSLEDSLEVLRNNTVLKEKGCLNIITLNNKEIWSCPLISQQMQKTDKISSQHKISGRIGGLKSGEVRRQKAETKKQPNRVIKNSQFRN